MGSVVCNPNNPDILGIRNGTANAWTYIKADGKQIPVAPGKSAAVQSGAKLNFGKEIGDM